MPPSVGNTSAAITLNKKITLMACAISSSSASITGAVAAMAEPPQMEEPTPTSVEILLGMRSARQSTKEMMSEVAIVLMMMGSDVAPTCAIWARLRPKPKRITAYWRIFFEVNFTPTSSGAADEPGTTSASTIPMRIANTGPPITSNCLPSSHAGTAITRQNRRPFQICLASLTKSIRSPSIWHVRSATMVDELSIIISIVILILI